MSARGFDNTAQSASPLRPAPFVDLPTDPGEIFRWILDPEKRGSDHVRLYHQLRTVAPVYQADLPRMGNPWILTRYEDDATLVRHAALIKDERVLAMSGGSRGPFVETLSAMFAFMPPPRHTHLRSLVSRGFTPRSVEQQRPNVEALVHRLIDEKLADGQMDLVADYAFRVPVTVICQILGAPVEDVPIIEDWSNEFSKRADEGMALTPEAEAAGDEAARGFMAYVYGLIEERRRAPRDDLLTRLIDVQRESDLSDESIAATSILLFQAGHETTANMISKGALALLRHPEQLAKLRAYPQLAENATEELLRYDTPVQMTSKFAAEDIPFHGRTIREGDPVTVLRGAVNRDPARWEDPDRLDIERRDIGHNSFGMGAHFCLGASLARLEIQQAILALAERLPTLRLEVDEPAYKPQLHLHGLASLPVSW